MSQPPDQPSQPYPGEDGTQGNPPPSPYPPFDGPVGATPPPPTPPPGAETPPPPGAGTPPPYYAPQGGTPSQNTKAVIGLVCGILGIIMAFCCSILGVPLGVAGAVLGHLAKQEGAVAGGSQANSAGIAQGAFITGIVALGLSLVMVVLGLVLNVGMGLWSGSSGF